MRNGTLIDTLFMQQLSQKWILILGLAYIMYEWKAPIEIDDWVNFSTMPHITEWRYKRREIRPDAHSVGSRNLQVYSVYARNLYQPTKCF